jgi:hypothetical protein
LQNLNTTLPFRIAENNNAEMGKRAGEKGKGKIFS